MALTVSARGTGTHNSAATSFTLSPGSNCAAGSTVVLCVAADNSASAGSSNDFTTVTDSLGNAWTKRRSPVFDNGAASAGVQGAIYTTQQNIGTVITSTVITVNFGSSPTAKTWTLTEIVPAAGKSAAYRTGGDKAAGATGTALTTGASASVTVGEVIIAAFFMEAGTTQSISAEDTDGTNGSWTTSAYAEIGTTTAGSVIASSTKIQATANSTQSYDITVGVSSDYHASYAIFTELTLYTLTAASGSIAETGTATTLKAARLVTADGGSLALAGTAATLKRTTIMSAAGGSAALTGSDATLTYAPVTGYTLIATAGSIDVTGTAATPRAARVVSASAGSIAATGTDASLLAARIIAASAGTASISGAAIGGRATRVISANSASVAVAGVDAGMVAGRVIGGGAGSISSTGASVTLVYSGSTSYVLTATGGSSAVTGAAAGLLSGRVLSPGAAGIDLTGWSATLVWTRINAVSAIVLEDCDHGWIAATRDETMEEIRVRVRDLIGDATDSVAVTLRESMANGYLGRHEDAKMERVNAWIRAVLES